MLKGDRSLVGLRPELPLRVNTQYESWQKQRFTVRPGIAGWWQVSGRKEAKLLHRTPKKIYTISSTIRSGWISISC